MKAIIKKAIEFILQQILPHFLAFRGEKVITIKAKKLKKIDYEFTLDKKKDIDEILKEIKEFYQREKDRKGTVEDKAKACLFIIALTITLILGSLNYIKVGQPGTHFIVLLLLIIGVIYLVLSAITAIKAFNIGEYHDFYLHDRIKEDGIKLNIVDMGSKDKISFFYIIIKLNQMATNIRSNYVYATFVGIRNGIILISIFFILAVMNLYFHNQTQEKKIKDKIVENTIMGSKDKTEKKIKEPSDTIIDTEVSPEITTKDTKK